MPEPDIPWDPASDLQPLVPQAAVETLRAHFDQVKADEAQVEQRKTELIQTVREQIATLERILMEAGAEPAMPAMPAPSSTIQVRPPALTPIIDYVRRELTAVGHPIETAVLRQALLTKHHLAPERLKNLSQVLYKAKSIVKSGGKVGLVTWKQPRPMARTRAARSPKESAHADVR